MPFQILSISGGGFLGYFSAQILEKLEERKGSPLGGCFDLIAGTSIGGILALGLALEIPAIKIRETFDQEGIHIFSDRKKPKTILGNFRDFLRSAARPKYSGRELRQTLTNLFGEDTKIGDLIHPVLIPSVNLSVGKPQIFKTRHHPTFQRDLHRKVVDVAMATSAAPIFFPPADLGDEGLFADGGVFANAPDVLALHEAEHFLKIKIENIRILSIGTTSSKFSFYVEQRKKYGAWHWAKDQKLARVVISTQQQIVDSMITHKLGESYLRLDDLQSPEQVQNLALDVATSDARQTLSSLAEHAFRKSSANVKLDQFLGHSATSVLIKA